MPLSALAENTVTSLFELYHHQVQHVVGTDNVLEPSSEQIAYFLFLRIVDYQIRRVTDK